ncbi:MAG: flippase [Methylocystaceae bacterium]|nr:flippase [Methylocystaceae bacterium]
MEANRLKKVLIRGFVGSGALRFGFAFLSFLLTISLARMLQPEGYGVYSFVFAVAYLLAVPAQAGVPGLLVRQVALYSSRAEWGLLRGMLWRSSQMICFLSLALAACLVIGSYMLDGNSERFYTFLWAALLIPLVAFNSARSAVLRGLNKVVKGQLPEMLLAPLFFLVLIWIVQYFQQLTPTMAIALNCLALAASFSVGSAILNRNLPKEVGSAQAFYDSKAWLKSILPFALIAGMQVINLQVSVVSLGMFSNDYETGLFRVAFQTANLVSLVLIALNTVVSPRITQMFYAGNQSELQKMVTWSARLGLLVATPIAVVFVFYGDWVLVSIFGSKYEGADEALILLTCGQLFSVFMGPVAVLLNMTGNEQVTLKGMAFAVFINVMLNLSLTPTLGITGAAISSMVSLIALNASLGLLTRKYLAINSVAIMKLSKVGVKREG